jgi:hypothetical protein
VSAKKKDPTKRHRHDFGLVDHGPASTASTTRSIQALLGICVILSAALLIYALAHMGVSTAAP